MLYKYIVEEKSAIYARFNRRILSPEQENAETLNASLLSRDP